MASKVHRVDRLTSLVFRKASGAFVKVTFEMRYVPEPVEKKTKFKILEHCKLGKECKRCRPDSSKTADAAEGWGNLTKVFKFDTRASAQR